MTLFTQFKSFAVRSPLIALGVVVLCTSAHADSPTGNWPQFRGQQASGVDARVELPTDWDVETGENISWQTEIPGLAHSAPIVWGDRIYLTTVVSESDPELSIAKGAGAAMTANDAGPQQWRLLAIDKVTGEVLFNRLCLEGVPRVQRRMKSTLLFAARLRRQIRGQRGSHKRSSFPVSRESKQ